MTIHLTHPVEETRNTAHTPYVLSALKGLLAVVEWSFEPSQEHLDNTGWVEGARLKAAAETARAAIARAEGV